MRSSVFAALYAGMTTITRSRVDPRSAASAIVGRSLPAGRRDCNRRETLLVAREDAEALADGGGLLLDGLEAARVHQCFEDFTLVCFLLARRALQRIENLAYELRNLALRNDQITACDRSRPRAAVGTQNLQEPLTHLATGVHAVHAAH